MPIIAGALLADAQSPVRQAAADALAATRQRSHAGLLFLRWKLGDDDPLVVMACMAGALGLAPDVALPEMRAALFQGDDVAREVTVLVLAQSGRDDALDLLLAYIEEAPLVGDRPAAVRALGLHRSDRALAALLEIVATGERAEAEVAIGGLAARRFESGIRARVESAAGRSGLALGPAIEAAFAESRR